LSGVFPFNESTSIYDQIKKFKCIFPSKYWNDKSEQSIDFIQLLLQVAINRRLEIIKAKKHGWFLHDNDLYYNLLDLEERTGEKWLITKEFEDIWESTSL
jgi:serine/threonine protein kinase